MNNHLEIDLRGLSNDMAELKLTSHMFFPSGQDDGRYREYLAQQYLAIAADEWEEYLKGNRENREHFSKTKHDEISATLRDRILPIGGWSTLANGAIGKGINALHVESRKRLLKGIAVGNVAYRVLQEGKSIEDAAGDLEFEINAFEKTIRYFKMTPESFVRHSWRKWKPAAHLWATYTILSRMHSVEEKGRWINFRDFPNGLAGFVDESVKILRVAAKTFPKTGPREPILNPDDCWRVIL